MECVFDYCHVQVVRMPGSPDLVRTQWRARGPCRVTAQNHEEMLTSGVTKNHSAHTPRDLFEGTEGPEVRQLQQFLVIEGYLPEDSHITGYVDMKSVCCWVLLRVDESSEDIQMQHEARKLRGHYLE